MQFPLRKKKQKTREELLTKQNKHINSDGICFSERMEIFMQNYSAMTSSYNRCDRYSLSEGLKSSPT